MTTVPVRLRIGCHVTTLGELDVDDTDEDHAAETYAQLAALLDHAATDLRERMIPEALRGEHRQPEGPELPQAVPDRRRGRGEDQVGHPG